MAKVTIPTPLRKFTDQKRAVTERGNSVDEVLQSLVTDYPELKGNLYDDEGNLRSYVKIYIGEQEISELDGINTDVGEETELNIIPAIAGGCCF